MISAKCFLLAESILLSPFRIIFARTKLNAFCKALSPCRNHSSFSLQKVFFKEKVECFLQVETALQKVLNFLFSASNLFQLLSLYAKERLVHQMLNAVH